MKKKRTKQEVKEEIEQRYFDMSDEEKIILKKFDLFYYEKLARYKIARALLILEDRIKELENKLFIKNDKRRI